MYEKALDNLEMDERIEGTYKGSFNFKGDEVRIHVDPDGEKLEYTITLAKRILSSLDAYDKKARGYIIENSLQSYNEDWREDDEPILTAMEFDKNLRLDGVNFLSSDSVDFFYSENNMFGGHSLIPQIFDSENFEYLQMYG
ncbi:DUF2262 domain-containing protein [Pseudoalteromonas sp. SR44-5]|uniref:DUF2262 domain-containing protein n=1 Tax=Pseudoalteromonas sp. SR44-5 TaxID=2760934 RepID=UPI0016048044|nr:DUF2262 domain-containing protein [Pseudoalteromonas sp. SR44-5]MBB1366054.1 DUF2262 domain-containing protein [Pseudoalteromonas sp. SR44-5]